MAHPFIVEEARRKENVRMTYFISYSDFFPAVLVNKTCRVVRPERRLPLSLNRWRRGSAALSALHRQLHGHLLLLLRKSVCTKKINRLTSLFFSRLASPQLFAWSFVLSAKSFLDQALSKRKTMSRRGRASTMEAYADDAFQTPLATLTGERIADSPKLGQSRTKRSLGPGQGYRAKRRKPLPSIPDDLEDNSVGLMAVLPVRRGHVEIYTPSTYFIPTVDLRDEPDFAEDFIKPGLPLMPSPKDLSPSTSQGTPLARRLALAPRFASCGLQLYY